MKYAKINSINSTKVTGGKMKKKRLRLFTLVFVAIFVLTGCGTPLYEMTDEEEDLVVHYAAYVLAKHNVKQKDGLNSKVPTAEELSDKDTEKEDPGSQEGILPDPDAAIISIGKALGTNDMLQMTYNGYRTSDTYKEGSYYLLKANKGYVYVIMNFTIRNGSADPMSIDAFKTAPDFSVDFTGEGYVEAETTFLTYSLSTYQGNLKSGETVDVVLLFQIPGSSTSLIKEPTFMNVDISGTKSIVELQKN